MNESLKPLWLEGMFLRPQHLQQHDRWVEATLEQRVQDLEPYSWGLRSIEIDTDSLAIGQFQLSAIEAVLPDGTVFSTGKNGAIASARQVTVDDQGKKVYLALPLRSSGQLELGDDQDLRRYSKRATNVRNTNEADKPEASIAVGSLTGRLVLEGDSLDETTHLPIAEIDSVSTQGEVKLSENFIPPLLKAKANAHLISQIDQVRSLLRKRGEMLASNTSGQGESTRSGIIDLMALSVTNHYEVLFGHIAASGRHAPEQVYRDFIGLIGAFSAFGADNRRPPELPAYDHLDLRLTFQRLVTILEGLLSFVVEQNAISIPLSKRDYGVWLGETTNKGVYSEGRSFVLIAHANVSLEVLRTQMPIQIKVGPVEKIRELVNLQLPGVAITPMSVAPRQIPYVQNAVYFELDVENELWPQMQSSAAFALHLSGDYPGLGLELWAVHKGQ
ncbi:type VI secretion system baseplate subunit TssK [Roseibium sediminicola]|uniref:Type VI secretion system baseplate subunit TssK n=1 Tax=Roseibium sediminicola TaxID=2933272 RepID=A0ABT0GWW1_9HYPH|nr:type VI secretion system baseplate subunit TssK [Roseibium sp. CAU 1639]MCK7613273.1 type VI secretion system baseplate subunit TssK [Roseibium sp. CAU 1639]